MLDLPFDITCRLTDRRTGVFTASVGGEPVTAETYRLGNGNRRRDVAEQWADNARLRNGRPIDVAAIESELHRTEQQAFRDFDSACEAEAVSVQAERAERRERAAETKNERGPSQGTLLADLGGQAELFHDSSLTAYARIQRNDHFEVWPLRCKSYKALLSRMYYDEEGKAPGSQAMADALTVLEGKASFDGPERTIHTRIAGHDGLIYIDLCNDLWEVIEVSASGWQVIQESPVVFRRGRGMKSIAEPIQGGSIAELRRFVNVKDEGDFVLLVAFILQAMRPEGQYPILVLDGEQGSAKSCASRVVRLLVDPNAAPLRTAPKEARDLMIQAKNSWCLGFDNLSRIPEWLSDAFCRLSTGGGFSTRELYSDDEEIIFEAKRPVVVNGIESLTTRPDLIDRRIGITLLTIPESKRLAESEFWRTFEAARPRIFGALLDALVVGLGNIATVELDRLPRMADFARWIEACEPGLPWERGTFRRVYGDNREDANEIALEGSVIAAPIREWSASWQDGHTWTGTASDLLRVLETRDRRAAERKGWPKSARVLSGMLRRIAPNLNAIGIQVTFRERTRSGRLIEITRKSVPVDGCDDSRDGRDVHLPSPKNRPGAIENAARDGRDGGDGQIPLQSNCDDLANDEGAEWTG